MLILDHGLFVLHGLKMPVILFFPLQVIVLPIFTFFFWFIIKMSIYGLCVYSFFLELHIGWSLGYFWCCTSGPSLWSTPCISPNGLSNLAGFWGWRAQHGDISGLWFGVGHQVWLLVLSHPCRGHLRG